MKVANTRRIAEKLMQTVQIEQLASMINALITNFINENWVIPQDIDSLRKEAIELQKDMHNHCGTSLSIDHIMMMLCIESMIAPYLGNQPQVMDFFMNMILNESKVFDVKEFSENPYIKNIEFNNKRQGDFEFRYEKCMPYELLIYDVPKRVDDLHINIPRVCCFPGEFMYPAIYQESIKSVWMSVTPNEVYTMKQPIKNAKGKVLTLGCGMGYFAYMVSLKETVESVTIIEIEQSVIDLFENFILPQFENKEKVTVIKADAIEFLLNMSDGEFDYCFADIWIGVADIEPYFAVKQVGRKFRKTKMDYWIEDSFATLLAANVSIEIMKGFYSASGIPMPDEENIPYSEDDIRRADYVARLLEGVEITKPEHIDYYMKPKNLLDMIDRTNIEY